MGNALSSFALKTNRMVIQYARLVGLCAMETYTAKPVRNTMGCKYDYGESPCSRGES